ALDRQRQRDVGGEAGGEQRGTEARGSAEGCARHATRRLRVLRGVGVGARVRRQRPRHAAAERAVGAAEALDGLVAHRHRPTDLVGDVREVDILAAPVVGEYLAGAGAGADGGGHDQVVELEHLVGRRLVHDDQVALGVEPDDVNGVVLD
ncbi:MAG: hypothetical protein ACK559_14335, partial [bacterium]